MKKTNQNVLLSIDEFRMIKDIIVYCYTEDYDLIDQDELVNLHENICNIDLLIDDLLS